MSDAYLFLAAPMVMCVILALMHCYLGLHVLARGVIFVDLSLAQVASFGATLALLWDPEHHSSLGYIVSLGATFVAAALFALARRYEKQFPQEALIGIVFALASAAVILVVDQLAHGAEHLKEAMVGQILWVDWHQVGETALIYFAVGLTHYLFRKQLLAASHGKSAHWRWDFLFYALFGVVITSSTHVAGVLMVFSFLIVPAVVSTIFSSDLKSRLIFGWIFSVALSILGMFLSYRWDKPVGAVMVVLFSLVPIFCLLLAPFLTTRVSTSFTRRIE